MPPSWKWPFDKLMNEHIEQVVKARKDKYGSGGAPAEDDDDGMAPNGLLGKS